MHALLQALCRIENLFLDPHYYLANLSSDKNFIVGWQVSKFVCSRLVFYRKRNILG